MLFPFAILLLLFWKQPKLNQEYAINTYGSLYNELKIGSKWALLFNVFYTLRRILFAGVAFLIPSLPFFQIQSLILQSILLIAYIGSFKPFEDPFTNKLEIFNEICILGASYHLITLTDYVDTSNVDLQYNVGWSLIAITVFNMLINIIIMMSGSIRNLRINIKKYSFMIKRWLKNRQKKKHQEVYKVQKFNKNDIEGRETDYSPLSCRTKKKAIDATIFGQSKLDETDFSNIKLMSPDSPQSNQHKKKKKILNQQRLTQGDMMDQKQQYMQNLSGNQGQSIIKKKGITQRAKKEAQKQAQKLMDIFGINSKPDQKINQTNEEGDVSHQFFNAFYQRELNLQKMKNDSKNQKNLSQRTYQNPIKQHQENDTNLAQFTYSPINARFSSNNTMIDYNFSSHAQSITFRDMQPQEEEKEDNIAANKGSKRFQIKPIQTQMQQPVLINNNNFFDNLDVRDSLEVHVGQQMEQLPSNLEQLPQNKNRTNKGFKKAKKEVKKTTI